MAVKVKYIVVADNGVGGSAVEDLMLKAGEIMKSWITHSAVHHLIKYEE
jgi:hypothetical protein